MRQMEDEFSGDKDATEEQMVESGGLDSTEQGFLQGYSEDEEVLECAECGVAIPDEKNIMKAFDGENYSFCSEQCVKEFEESLGN
jgi:hypothetical protein